MSRQVRVVVPASTANLGPGFDCLGLALALYHRLDVREEEGAGLELRVAGEGAALLARDETNAVYQAMVRAFAACGYRPGRLFLESSSQIPLACGLGSSAAACLAGLAAGMWLSRQHLDQAHLVDLALAAEGHADNVVPSLLGGFTVVAFGQGKVHYLRLEPPEELEAVVVVPDFTLLTRQARAVLPERIPFQDAVGNQGRVALLTAALAGGRLELLRVAMEDCLHQPYRARLIPGLEEVRQAGLEAGALGGALSGAGPAMLALVHRGDQGPALAMQQAWRRQGIASRALVLPVDRAGLQIQVNPGEIYE